MSDLKMTHMETPILGSFEMTHMKTPSSIVSIPLSQRSPNSSKGNEGVPIAIRAVTSAIRAVTSAIRALGALIANFLSLA